MAVIGLQQRRRFRRHDGRDPPPLVPLSWSRSSRAPRCARPECFPTACSPSPRSCRPPCLPPRCSHSAPACTRHHQEGGPAPPRAAAMSTVWVAAIALVGVLSSTDCTHRDIARARMSDLPHPGRATRYSALENRIYQGNCTLRSVSGMSGPPPRTIEDHHPAKRSTSPRANVFAASALSSRSAADHDPEQCKPPSPEHNRCPTSPESTATAPTRACAPHTSTRVDGPRRPRPGTAAGRPSRPRPTLYLLNARAAVRPRDLAGQHGRHGVLRGQARQRRDPDGRHRRTTPTGNATIRSSAVTKWQTFLTRELPPIIDAEFSGNGTNSIAAISMTATSVLNLAIAAPGLYRAVGSYSGCAETSTPMGSARGLGSCRRAGAIR